jgi:uncharacterized protein
LIQFEQRAQIGVRSPRRADVALFVGAVARREAARVDPVLPRARAADPLYRWLEAEGWTSEERRRERAPLEALLDVPVPIESFAEFERLFAWEQRSVLDARIGATYLGLAVRAFFLEGGRRCYVVRVGDPWPPGASGNAVELLIPNVAGRPTGSAVDRSTWRGLWHLYGLPEVSFVCLPDLPDACAPPPPPPQPLPAPPAPPELFVECSGSLATRVSASFLGRLAAPRCDAAGYRRWAAALRVAVEGIERGEPTTTLREVQLVGAVPLPWPGLVPQADGALLDYLNLELRFDRDVPWGLGSAFLQLVYPWVRMVGSEQLPEGLASPDGAFAGLLAANALTRGTFHSVAGWGLSSVLELEPPLRRAELDLRSEVRRNSTSTEATASLDQGEQLAVTPRARDGAAGGLAENLVRRVSLLSRRPDGVCVASDVTTSREPSYRQAHVRRLLNAVIRGAREIGETDVFEASGPALWESLRDQLTRMLRGLWVAGAFRGSNEQEAFGVRCDQSTMSQSDLDGGRVIVEIELAPAPAIERIIVSLSVQNGTVSTRAA